MVIDTAPSVILWLDAQGRILEFNRAAERLYGKTRTEVLGKNYFELFLPAAVRARFIADTRKVLAGTPTHGFENAVRAAGGGERILAWSVERSLDARGRPTGVIAVGQDVTEHRRVEETLRQNEEALRLVLETMPVGIWITDRDGRIVHGNPEGRRIWGGARYVGVERYGEYKGWWADTGKRIEAQEWAPARAIRKGEVSLNEVIDIECFDGTRKTILNSAIPLRDAQRGIVGAIVVNQDITAARRAEAEMRKLSGAVHQAGDVIVITDRDGTIEYVNPAFERITGYGRDEAVGGKPSLLKSGVHDQAFYQKLWATLLAGETFRGVLVNRRKSGELYYEQATITPLKDAQGRITHFISTSKDITEHMQAQERLQYLAHHDVLTDLPNRILFMDRLEQALIRAHWRQRIVGVMFLDLDRFKRINDELGHHAGDGFLRAAAQRLRSSVHERDTVARFGGDEFAILLEELAQPGDVPAVAGKILEALASPFALEGREFRVTASIGISLYPGDGEERTTLLRNADAAMYRAKEAGKNCYRFYSQDSAPSFNAPGAARAPDTGRS